MRGFRPAAFFLLRKLSREFGLLLLPPGIDPIQRDLTRIERDVDISFRSHRQQSEYPLKRTLARTLQRHDIWQLHQIVVGRLLPSDQILGLVADRNPRTDIFQVGCADAEPVEKIFIRMGLTDFLVTRLLVIRRVVFRVQ